MKPISILVIILIGTLINSCTRPEIQLIVRADDMGFCNAANMAIIQSYKQGIVSSAEVLVPAPNFKEASALLRENPSLDVGVHLCLTSEYDNYKWGPITNSPSLLADNGYFPTTCADLVALPMSEDEIRMELRAQIDTALKYIPQVTHLSTHMFQPIEDKRIRKVINELSDEYKLPFRIFNSHYSNFWSIPASKKEDEMARYLNKLVPGLHIFVLHPGYDDSEMQAITGQGKDPVVHMAEHRQAVTNALGSERVKRIIAEKEIRLVSYGDICKMD